MFRVGRGPPFEKVNFTILRGRGVLMMAKIEACPAGASACPNFEFHGAEGWIRPGLAPGDLTPCHGSRDVPMYKSGVLHRAVFVEGEMD